MLANKKHHYSNHCRPRPDRRLSSCGLWSAYQVVFSVTLTS